VLVLALVAVVLVLAGALGLLTGAQSARGRAQAAADLAALAAAEVISAPRGLVLAAEALAAAKPCDLAGDVVGRNGARMTACRVIGDRAVEIEAEVPTPGLGPATAVARAGPAFLR
jgi:secretion/DNA translocation related TadE-like protein